MMTAAILPGPTFVVRERRLLSVPEGIERVHAARNTTCHPMDGVF
jgi:hypothetical protein